jgi:hypothetical protein
MAMLDALHESLGNLKISHFLLRVRVKQVAAEFLAS